MRNPAGPRTFGNEPIQKFTRPCLDGKDSGGSISFADHIRSCAFVMRVHPLSVLRERFSHAAHFPAVTSDRCGETERRHGVECFLRVFGALMHARQVHDTSSHNSDGVLGQRCGSCTQSGKGKARGSRARGSRSRVQEASLSAGDKWMQKRPRTSSDGASVGGT